MRLRVGLKRTGISHTLCTGLLEIPSELDEVGKIIRSAKKLASRYRLLTGRPLGITGEVAEYEAARLLGLELAAVRQAGFDAVRTKSSRVERFQVKGRCVLSTHPGQRLRRFTCGKGKTAS